MPETAHTVELAGDTYTLERITGYKAARVFAIARAISAKSDDLVKAWAKARAEYERDNVRELDRGAAMLRYGPEPLVVGGRAILYPDTVEVDGKPQPHPKAGEVVMVPGPLDDMTDEAWTAMGNKISVPRKPTTGELIVAVLPQAIGADDDDEADLGIEEHVFKLLALVTLDNSAVKAAWKGQGVGPLIEERLDLILEADLDELIELAVVAGELVDDQVFGKLERLGERAGKALRLVGLNLTRRDQATTSTPATSPDTQSSSRPTLSTDGARSTDGDPPTPSAPPSSSSRPSAPALSATEPD